MPSKELAVTDIHLGTGRFGSGDALCEDAQQLIEAVGDLVASCCNLSLNPFTQPSVPSIVRQNLIESAFVEAQSGRLASARAKIEMANRLTQHRYLGDPCSTSGPLRPIPSYSDESGSLLVEVLTDSMRRDGFLGVMNFVEPNAESLAMTQKAENLLQDLVPSVWSGTRGAVFAFAIVRAEFESAYNAEAPRSFMINERMFADPLMAADTILHESLHQKMADIRCTSLFFAGEYDDIESRERGDVMVPWGKNAPRPFSLARALATHHVYVHSSLLYAIALARCQDNANASAFLIDPTEIARRLKRALDRANFMGAALEGEFAASVFGTDAKQMIHWLNDALKAIVAAGGLSIVPDRYRETQLQLI